MNLSILRNKRLRHGSLSLVFTAIVVVLVVIINVIASSLYDKYRPSGDMTNNELYTISDTTKELLADVTAPVKIIFCSDPDRLNEGSEFLRYIHQTALEYQSTFDFVTVEYRDIYTNPTSMDKYKTSEGTNINQYSIVVESGTEYRLFAVPAFYKVSEETGYPFAYDGEMKFTSTILQITASDMPIAYFTNTHGETVDTADTANHSALWTLLENAGFEVRLLDLTTEEISPDARVIVINNPRYDFSGREETGGEGSEIQKLDDFLSNYGSLLVFRDPVYYHNLPNLDEYLEEWGVKFGTTTVRDTAHSIPLVLGGAPYNGYGIIAEYPTSGLGASVVSSIRDLAASPKTIVPMASPIYMLDILDSSKDISPILTTYDGATLQEGGEIIEKDGKYNLMTLSRYTRVKDNTEFYSYVLACASPYYSTDMFLESSSYANEDVIYSALRAMGKEKVPADIDFKVLASEALDITEAEQTQWTWILILTLPIVITAIGTVVFVRRKHS